MKIQCKLQREGGTKVDIDDQEYFFKPDAQGRHVAEVTIKAHIERFLSILEGYGLPDDDVEESENRVAATVKKTNKTAEPPVVKQESDSDPDVDNSGDDLGSNDSDAAAEEEKQAEYEAERAELTAQYVTKFGSKPHHKLTNESIRAKLAAE